jgi:deoxyribodipyrimidine photo-lyase
LSPYIRHRLITEEEVVRAVVDAHGMAVARRFVEEVAWRVYFKGHMELFPAIWRAYVNGLDAAQNAGSPEAWAQLEQARNGRSGIECLDFWVRELRRNGYLHNHARMSFASIWTFTLGLPWQAGAALFLDCLLDGDAAVNTLAWRWVVGLHTRGKAYTARPELIRKYSSGAFYPVNQLNPSPSALPWDGPFSHQGLAAVHTVQGNQSPDIDQCPAGLLVTPDDLSVELSELSNCPFSSVAAFSAYATGPLADRDSQLVKFVDHAVMDAAERAAANWDGELVKVRDGRIALSRHRQFAENVGRSAAMRIYAGRVDDWIEAVLHWASNETLNSVWMMQPPVGPCRDQLPRLKSALLRRGIRLLEFRRPWDNCHWPHAAKGYFGFRKGFAERLTQFGIQ